MLDDEKPPSSARPIGKGCAGKKERGLGVSGRRTVEDCAAPGRRRPPITPRSRGGK
ncbi:hypothetical protein HMPREF9440_01291 [Sutterella parvirubra YIT 11816]|uniref:Uncharacterized protein n=1 Tax=Sutterella parvirubra YIT 11816 TaxID=762967 RepID=H3KEX6_9BURK|nr:hypothetical protein HMPREF9440_01291 [Sutterella parvirubra YIT 11816]